ncbi:MAG: hypothetical protein WCQ16_00605 [Verrucomicrobiae bacterium]
MNVRNKKIFLLVCLGWMACGPALAKKTEPIGIPPPFAKAGAGWVYLNGSAEVALSVGGRVVEPLTFLIRKPPRYGALSNLRRTGRTSAVVTYTPDRAAVPGDDIFTFAAQSPDSPVSAPASVWIRLLEKPPVLEHQESLDFGTVYLGDTSVRELVLKNSGGGQAIGQILASPPWSVSGNAIYHVPSGSESRIRLVFHPTEARDFTDRIPLGNDATAAVALRGAGAAPLAWPKAGLVFSPEQRAEGFAEVALSNESPRERTLTFEWPDFVKAPREIPLAPGATVSVKAGISGPVKIPFQGSVKFQFGNFTGELPLTVYPGPAKLVVIPESALELGETQKGKELRGKFTVRNTGESDAPVRISAPDEMMVVPDPGNTILRAGEERGFEIQYVSFKPGPYSGTIVVRTTSGDPVPLHVNACFREGPSLPVEKFLNIPGALPARSPELPTGKVPPVPSASLVFSTPHEVEIGWALTAPETSGYKIQRRKISSAEDGRLLIEWLDWPFVKIHIADGKALARWERLPENSFWTIRIIGLDALGNPGPPSPAFQISTRPEKRIFVSVWVWCALLVAAAAGAVRLAVKRRRALLAREDERLARLEAE